MPSIASRVVAEPLDFSASRKEDEVKTVWRIVCNGPNLLMPLRMSLNSSLFLPFLRAIASMVPIRLYLMMSHLSTLV